LVNALRDSAFQTIVCTILAREAVQKPVQKRM
jgi:hypothetical protein